MPEPSDGENAPPAPRSRSDQPQALRLFIGVPVSMRSLRAVAAAASELRERSEEARHFRWVSPARYHVTLKFLGWVRPEVVPALRDRVGKALREEQGFELRCQDLGAFPKPERARVLWAGLGAGAQRLAALAQRIDDATADLGFAREARPFHAHVTMARIKRPTDVVSLLQGAPVRMFSKSVIDRVVLYESNLKSGASEYTRIHSWTLEAPSKTSRRQSREVERETATEHSRPELTGTESSASNQEQGKNGDHGKQDQPIE